MTRPDQGLFLDDKGGKERVPGNEVARKVEHGLAKGQWVACTRNSAIELGDLHIQRELSVNFFCYSPPYISSINTNCW